MTTYPAPPERTPRVLLAGTSWVLASTVVLVVAASVASGATGALSAAVGGVIVLVFFGFGAVVVGTASNLAPSTAVLVALVTYTFQVVLVGLVFAALTKADAFESDLSSRWLSASLIVGTFAWIAGQLITTVRTPIQPWEPTVSAEEADAA